MADPFEFGKGAAMDHGSLGFGNENFTGATARLSTGTRLLTATSYISYNNQKSSQLTADMGKMKLFGTFFLLLLLLCVLASRMKVSQMGCAEASVTAASVLGGVRIPPQPASASYSYR
ncbi:hypothetical protein V6N11_028216 [Hibiscus sabdariffa]|uniref:Uncharacterized protein n=1 Tax=Hibiscus sabdariffa TaxID=183260 RepID=A0ABR2N8C2_9ROSI